MFTLLRPLIEAMLVSTAVSVLIAFVILAIFRGETGRRYAGAVGFAAGFVVAFALLEPRYLIPSLYWHWLPWLTVGASVISPVGIATGVCWPERWFLGLVFGLTAAWFLVPTRAALQPWRLTYIFVFAGSLVVLGNLLDALLHRSSPLSVFIAMCITALSCSGLVAHEWSLQIGALGAIGSASLAGGGLASAWTRDEKAIRGLLAGYAVVLCCVVLTAHLGDGIPKPAPILILIAPLTLWLFEFGPLSRLRGIQALTAKSIAVGLPLSVAWFA